MFDDAPIRSGSLPDPRMRHRGQDLGFRYRAFSRRTERRPAILAGAPMRARSIFLQQEPDRLNRLALVVALASALTGLTLLASTTSP